jgi:hypothetical protein
MHVPFLSSGGLARLERTDQQTQLVPRGTLLASEQVVAGIFQAVDGEGKLGGRERQPGEAFLGLVEVGDIRQAAAGVDPRTRNVPGMPAKEATSQRGVVAGRSGWLNQDQARGLFRATLPNEI